MLGEQRNARTSGWGEGEEYELKAPTDEPTYNLDEPREARIVSWRLDCFMAAGMETLHATSLAVRRDVDRDTVERLLKAGATSAQVRDICS